MSQGKSSKNVTSDATAPGNNRASYICGVEPIIVPEQQHITLQETLVWFSKHFAYIPESVAQEIDEYGVKWQAALPVEHKKNLMLFPPDPWLAELYRKATTAQCLYDNLAEIDDHRTLWLTWEAIRVRKGSKSWTLRFTSPITNRREAMSLGSWPKLDGIRHRVGC